MTVFRSHNNNQGAYSRMPNDVRRHKPFAIDIARAIQLIQEMHRKICVQSHVQLSMRHHIWI